MTNNAHMSPQTPNILHKIVFLIISLAMALASVCAYSQIRIDWQQCYGSMSNDWATRIVKKPNGYWIAGRVTQQSGMVTIPVLNRSWVIGIDETGGLVDEISLGPYAVQIDEDMFGGINEGVFYALGHPTNELENVQLGIKKLDANGHVVWETMVGGMNESFVNSMRCGTSALDGGVIASSCVQSAGGDVTNHYGLDDVWVVKTDSLGRLEWETTLGTENREWPSCIVNASDGGCYVGMMGNPGYVGSIPVCQVPSTDEGDVLFGKLDSAGHLLWLHCYGGSMPDIIDHVIELEDGFLLVCDTQSDDRDAEGAGYHVGNGPNRTYDVWLIRTDYDGNIVWSRCYGGTGTDFPIKAFQNEDGGFTVFCHTLSIDGDVQSAQNLQIPEDYHYYSRLWVFRIDADGNLLWERAIGTRFSEVEPKDVIKLSDTEYTILATVELLPWEGFEGDLSCTNWDDRLCDCESYWVLHFTDVFDYNSVEEGTLEESRISVYPNPTRGMLTISGKGLKRVNLYDLLGQQVAATPSYNGINAMVDTSSLVSGIYLVRVYTENGLCVKRVVVAK